MSLPAPEKAVAEPSDSKAARFAAAFVAVSALTGVVMSYIFAPGAFAADVARRTANFFSYFTILTNLLVAGAGLSATFAPDVAPTRFLNGPTTRATIAAYIALVAAIYHALLRGLFHPEGLYLVADIFLHTVTPVLAVLVWALFQARGEARLRLLPRTLLFPAVYTAYTLVRGALTGWYPYPFLHAAQAGLARVLLNSIGLAVVFLLTTAAFILADKALGRLRRVTSP